MVADNTDFDWDEANITHIAEHEVEPYEAEEVVANHPLDMDFQTHEGEQRFRQVGETNTGRILVVVTTQRGELTRVITAYPASRTLSRLYISSKGVVDDGETNPS